MIKLNDIQQIRIDECLIQGFMGGEENTIIINYNDRVFYASYKTQEERDKDLEKLDEILFVHEMDEIINRRENTLDCCEASYLRWEDLDFEENKEKTREVLFNGEEYLVQYMEYSNNDQNVVLKEASTGNFVIELWGSDAEDVKFFNLLQLWEKA